MTSVFRLTLVAAAVALLGGCSSSGNKSMEYRTATPRQSQATLEVPPELTAPSTDERFAIPDPKSQTTFSTYSRERGTSVPAGASGVLPKVDNARIERFGDQRWLVVKAEPDKVWPLIKDFWVETGFVVRRDSPEVGIMETDWAENRAKIPQDIVRSTVGRVFDGLYSTGERDKFRTRIEKGAEPGTTEIYVSHRGMQEVYTSGQQERTVWQPRAADRELEAEMLGRILVKFGFDDRKLITASAAGAPLKGSTAAEPRNAALPTAGSGPLVVNDGFDRAWRRVGLALDRVGFTVEDRDRSKGLYFVRYVDPESDQPPTKDGVLNKLAFWRSTPKTSTQPQYRIHVSDAGANMSHVEVQNAAGAPESSSTGKKILTLLFDQMK